jgi:phospholipase D1/2
VARFRPLLVALACALVVLGIALAWRYTPLSQLVTADNVRAVLRGVRDEPWAILIVILVFVFAGAIVFPLNILILTTAAVFGPWLGILYGGAGTVTSGLVMFLIGGLLGREALYRMLGERWRHGLEGLRKRGLLAVVTFRLLPIAPFTLVNLAAGASGIRFVDFLLGTLIGMLPGLVLLSVMGDRIVRILADPSLGDIAILVLCVAGLIGLAVAAQAFLARRGRRA